MALLRSRVPALFAGKGSSVSLLSGSLLSEKIGRLSREGRNELSRNVVDCLQSEGLQENDISGCIRIISALLEDKKSPTPATLPSAVALLQGLCAGKAALMTQRLAETLWAELRPGREPTAPLLVRALLERVAPPPSLEDQKAPATVDFKRLLVASEAVVVALQSDPQVEEALIRFAASPFIAKSSEGIRFLAGLLGSAVVPERVRAEIHASVRAQLPFCRKSRAQCYGEIYFRAWKTATTEKSAEVSDPESDQQTRADVHLEHFEKTYIQSMMAATIHVAKPTLRENLLSFLMAFHAQKRHRGVDELLHRLYEPILFRSFSVANPLVRANAANLFIDAFPIHSPTDGLQELEHSIQAQIAVIVDLLHDPVVLVRRIAVQGSCRIIAVYWDIIPAEHLRAVVNSIVTESAFDVTAPTVRAAVIDGLRHVYKENALARDSLKPALVGLNPLLNDGSETVRLSFVKLLLVLKETRTVKFFDIAPLPKLLSRLSTEDKPSIRLSLCNLLLNSYFPSSQSTITDKSIVAVQVARCVSLAKSNARAAVNFYSQLHLLSDMGLVCKFMKSLAKAVAYDSTFSPGNELDSTVDEDAPARRLLIRECLLEILAVLWTGCAKSVWRPGNEALADYMRKAFTLEVLEKLAYPSLSISSRVHAACWDIARCLALDEQTGRDVANSFLGRGWVAAFQGRLAVGATKAALSLLESAERTSPANMDIGLQIVRDMLKEAEDNSLQQAALLLLDHILQVPRLRNYLLFPSDSQCVKRIFEALQKFSEDDIARASNLISCKLLLHSKLSEKSVPALEPCCGQTVENFLASRRDSDTEPGLARILQDAFTLGFLEPA